MTIGKNKPTRKARKQARKNRNTNVVNNKKASKMTNQPKQPTTELTLVNDAITQAQETEQQQPVSLADLLAAIELPNYADSHMEELIAEAQCEPAPEMNERIKQAARETKQEINAMSVANNTINNEEVDFITAEEFEAMQNNNSQSSNNSNSDIQEIKEALKETNRKLEQTQRLAIAAAAGAAAFGAAPGLVIGVAATAGVAMGAIALGKKAFQAACWIGKKAVEAGKKAKAWAKGKKEQADAWVAKKKEERKARKLEAEVARLLKEQAKLLEALAAAEAKAEAKQQKEERKAAKVFAKAQAKAQRAATKAVAAEMAASKAAEALAAAQSKKLG